MTPLPAILLIAGVGTVSEAHAVAEGFPISCTYFSERDLKLEEHCAAKIAAGYALAPKVKRDLSYSHGLATLRIPDHNWFYRRHDGRMIEMMTFDNGPDDFVQGLARAVINGKLAYVDRKLNVRVRTRYDWGDRFDRGRAAVCIGCVQQWDADGEHSVMTGGRWGMIDRHGREVVPPTLTAAEFDQLARR